MADSTDLTNPTAASAALAELNSMLENAPTLLEVNSIQQRAEALRRVLQVAKADALWQNRFCAQRLKSMWRMGEMLAGADLHKGGRPSAEKPLTEGEGFKLADYGISYRLSSECQTIYRMSHERFDGYIARAQTDDEGNALEISKAGLLTEAAKPDDLEAQAAALGIPVAELEEALQSLAEPSAPRAESDAGVVSTEKQSATIIPLRKNPAQVVADITAVKQRLTADKKRRDAADKKRKKAKEPEAPAVEPTGTAHGHVEIWPPDANNPKWYVEVYDARKDLYDPAGEFNSEPSAEDFAERVRELPVEERFTIKYETEYWLSSSDDAALQGLMDDWNGSEEDRVRFAVALVNMDPHGTMCDPLVDAICATWNLHHPDDAEQTIKRLEARIAELEKQ
jgi:hypothetical protein